MSKWLAYFMTLALGAACGSTPDDGGGDDDDGGGGEVTYWRDAKPIIDAKCGKCHVEGGIAPFSLETYADAKTHAGVAQLAINDGIMPPWKATDDCNEYVGNRSLTADQKAVLNAWFDAGAPEGDPADEGTPLVDDTPIMGAPDVRIEMSQSYTPTLTPDDYRCFVVPWPEEYTATKYVTGFRAVPGNGTIVHHVIAFLATPDQVATYVDMEADASGPGYPCFGGTGGPAQTWIGGWAPGDLGSPMPEGTGIAVEPGSAIILQVHYNTLTDGAEPDVSAVELTLADSVTKEGAVQPWANPQWIGSQQMHIPPNEADVMHAFSFDATWATGSEFYLHGIGFHMHQLGTHGRVMIERADGSTECLLQVEDWDFKWQGDYGFKEPVPFYRGDKLYLECHWDNTPENQAVVDGVPLMPRDVYWGEGTTDEMCLTGFYWVPM